LSERFKQYALPGKMERFNWPQVKAVFYSIPSDKENHMYAFELSLQYRRAVKEHDLDTVLSLFTPDAIIVSPLTGRCDPKNYHEWLFAIVKNTTVEVLNAFQA